MFVYIYLNCLCVCGSVVKMRACGGGCCLFVQTTICVMCMMCNMKNIVCVSSLYVCMFTVDYRICICKVNPTLCLCVLRHNLSHLSRAHALANSHSFLFVPLSSPPLSVSLPLISVFPLPSHCQLTLHLVLHGLVTVATPANLSILACSLQPLQWQIFL